MRKSILLVILVAPVYLFGQTAGDVVRPFLGVAGPGSRAAGLAQSYTGIANDYSAMHYNPAGLAHVTRAELSFGGTYYSLNNNYTTDYGTKYTRDISRNYYNTDNVAYIWPVYGMKFTLGVGYNAVSVFNQAFSIEAQNFSETTNEESLLGAYTVSGGYQLQKELSMGASFHLYKGNNTYTTQHNEQGDDYAFQISSDYTGIGLTLGILWAPSDFSRTGISIKTPIYLDVDELYTEQDETRYDYRIQSPPEILLGQSFTLSNLMVTGSIAWRDWSLSRFYQDPDYPIENEAGQPIDIPINNTIKSEYQSALAYAGGAEVLLPWWNVKLRGGARYIPSHLRDDSPGDKIVVAAGWSVVLAQQFKIDFSYNRARWENRYSSQEYADIINSWSTITFSYRF